MKSSLSLPLLALLCLPTVVGCGSAGESSVTAASATKARIDGSKFLLAEEPDDAIGVIEAREETEDGESLVLVGRIGGSTNPWIEGRAAFMLLDASISVIDEGEECEEGEICTGDCCSTDRANCTTLVKVLDGDGQLVTVDSRELLGLNESDMVVVAGKAKKDDSGNFVMLANGVYIRR